MIRRIRYANKFLVAVIISASMLPVMLAYGAYKGLRDGFDDWKHGAANYIKEEMRAK